MRFCKWGPKLPFLFLGGGVTFGHSHVKQALLIKFAVVCGFRAYLLTVQGDNVPYDYLRPLSFTARELHENTQKYA